MMTRLITPSRVAHLDIRCTAVDVALSNVANHLVFFVERRLATGALADAFSQALTSVPLFAGRMTLSRGVLGIRCRGQGVPFSSVSSDRTLRDAMRSATGDSADWLVDPVNGATARWGLGPLCTVRVTHLADDATAIGVSFHHSIGDMQTLMILMRAWSAAAAGEPIPAPVFVEDRAAYLDEHLPPDGAEEPGLRCLGLAEAARSLLYMAKDGRKQRTLYLYFGEGETTRMRETYETGTRLSVNDVVCAHVCEALMQIDPAVDRRTLAISVNARSRCGLDPMLVGNLVTAVTVDVGRDDSAVSIAERIRRSVDHFSDRHCDMRINQQVFDDAGWWRGARIVTASFNPLRWNPLITNVSGFGVHRIKFGDAAVTYCTVVMKVPVAGFGSLIEGYGGRGLVFQMTLPPPDFEAMTAPDIQKHLHRFRCEDDDIPRLHREIHV
ncbi:acyltransferase [Mycolicibacterium sp. 120270]|uniref:acyltransferase n=1 Tax=Mycolicibacterium sp. 120270 TaxID=3090600 RepID=UPI00299E6C19|nr:acyltransferase [Mycolicibacterium sp. 120270]MDX1885589.1 acyltransferase [Mycolicibacterium sp. 120270]